MDILEKAESYAGTLYTQRRGNDFKHLSVGDRGLALALMEEVNALKRELQTIRQRQHERLTQNDVA